MTTPRWSPAEVLQIDPHSTCIGHAKTQGRRCRNPIAYANRQEAASILSDISRLNPQSGRVDCELEELASRLLCKRWHQDQVLAVKRQWLRRIENDQVAETVRRRVERPRTVQTATAPRAARSTVARSREAESGRERVASLVTPHVIQATFSLTISITISEVSGGRESNEPYEEPREPTGPETDSSSQQASATHQSNIPSSPSSTNTPIPPTISPQEASTTTEAEEDQEQDQGTSNEAEPPQPTPEPSTQPQQPQQPQHESPHPTHHSRRPIEGDCSICCEDFSGGDDTTWCRAQCRQNFHSDCVNAWHAWQVVDASVKTCPYW